MFRCGHVPSVTLSPQFDEDDDGTEGEEPRVALRSFEDIDDVAQVDV